MLLKVTFSVVKRDVQGWLCSLFVVLGESKFQKKKALCPLHLLLPLLRARLRLNGCVRVVVDSEGFAATTS